MLQDDSVQEDQLQTSVLVHVQRGDMAVRLGLRLISARVHAPLGSMAQVVSQTLINARTASLEGMELRAHQLMTNVRVHVPRGPTQQREQGKQSNVFLVHLEDMAVAVQPTINVQVLV